MKILTVVFGLGIGGTERAAVNFACAYKQLGYDSRLLCTGALGPRKGELDAKNIPLYGLDSTSLRLLGEWKPELLHFHSHLLREEDVVMIIEKLSAISIVETNVFSEPSPWEGRLDYSFQLSEWCKRLYLARGGDAEKARVVPNPISVKCFKRASLQHRQDFRDLCSFVKSDIVFGRVGQPIDAKWSPLVVETFNRLCNELPNARLLLVGAPPSIVEIAAQSPYCKQICCSQVVHDAHELSIVYTGIDVFLHVSEIGESFGMVLAESLLCNTPVVTLATPWADNSQGEVVRHGIGGLVATTPEALFECCKNLALDSQLRVRLGEAGAMHISDRYCSLEVAKAVIATCEGLAAGFCRYSHGLVCDMQKESYNLLTKVLISSFSFRKYTRFTTGYTPVLPAALRKIKKTLDAVSIFPVSKRPE